MCNQGAYDALTGRKNFQGWWSVVKFRLTVVLELVGCVLDKLNWTDALFLFIWLDVFVYLWKLKHYVISKTGSSYCTHTRTFWSWLFDRISHTKVRQNSSVSFCSVAVTPWPTLLLPARVSVTFVANICLSLQAQRWRASCQLRCGDGIYSWIDEADVSYTREKYKRKQVN